MITNALAAVLRPWRDGMAVTPRRGRPHVWRHARYPLWYVIRLGGTLWEWRPDAAHPDARWLNTGCCNIRQYHLWWDRGAARVPWDSVPWTDEALSFILSRRR